MVDPTHVIVVMVPLGAALDVSRVAEVTVAAGAKIVATHAVPVPITLADRRAVTKLLVHSTDPDGLSARLRDLSDQHGVDIALQPRAARCQSYGLAVFDMDSTLIDAEVIDELAIEAGVGEKVTAITEAAMRGEIDFTQSFIQRLALLEGLNAEVLQTVADRLRLNEGAEYLIHSLKQLGYTTAIVSGGFTFFGQRLQTILGVDYVYANELEIVNGIVTGKVTGDIIDGQRKADLLRELAHQQGLSLDQVIAVGDGANDLPMISIAGLGIAFRAKPVVKASAKQAISNVGLDGILYLLGYSDKDINKLH